ncbi:hypothetical protein R3P38DRAFT_3266900 [Favolaschia claudopus]|uniref:Zn(2)-C6 fungal-type domain-containing protein n=1 Tax=Favolaschia claudopus TaxID=2862362 RepID=A0AAW0BTZ4_9AGAR
MPPTSPRLFVPWVKRTDLACTPCRRRKIKCKISKDRPRDPCERCRKRHLECEYMSVTEQEDINSPEATPPPTTPPTISLPSLISNSPPQSSTSVWRLDDKHDQDRVDFKEETIPSFTLQSNVQMRGMGVQTLPESSATWTAPWAWPSERPVSPRSFYALSTDVDYSIFALDELEGVAGAAPTSTLESACFAEFLQPDDAYRDPWTHSDVWETLGRVRPMHDSDASNRRVSVHV